MLYNQKNVADYEYNLLNVTLLMSRRRAHIDCYASIGPSDLGALKQYERIGQIFGNENMYLENKKKSMDTDRSMEVKILAILKILQTFQPTDRPTDGRRDKVINRANLAPKSAKIVKNI